ncbi:MAG: amidase family protein, partial [Gammaproteobacteria bacterium]
DGVLPLHPRFDHVGPMTAHAHQLETLWRVLAGEPVVNEAPLGEPWRGLRVGFVIDAEAVGATSAVLHHYERGLQQLRALGAQLEPVAIAPLDPGKVRRAIFALCEHAIWLQHRQSLQREPQKYSPALTAMLRYGGSLDDSKLATFATRIKDFAQQLQTRTQSLQALVMPTSPGQAFDFEGPTPLDNADLTAIATAANLPAASVPLPSGDDLPVGLQIVTPAGEDSLACRLATAFENSAR